MQERQLLAMIRWADVRWLSWGWSKAVYVFDDLLVYSSGHLGSVYANAAQRGASQRRGDRPVPHYYERLEAPGDDLSLEQLVAEHHQNWAVAAQDVAAWSLHEGIVASRLRLELTDASRRKVLWLRGKSAGNSFAAIENALTQCLGSSRRDD